MSKQISQLWVGLTGNISGLASSFSAAIVPIKGVQAAVTGAGAAVASVGKNLAAFSSGVAALGTAVAAVALPTKAITAAADFEQALADLRAAANPTASEFITLRDTILNVGKATGTSAVEVSGAFAELLKAGMGIEEVMGGAAEAAVQFARVGGISVPEAAVVMSDAINVFAKSGITATEAIDTLAKAAAASSISVPQIAQAFSQAASVFGAAGMSLGELSTAIGILGNNAIKGSDAGTALRTMLSRLQNPTDDAAAVVSDYGLVLRNAAGEMRPFRELVGELQAKLGQLDPAAKSAAVSLLFGQDAMRAGLTFIEQGTAGWDEFTATLAHSQGVSDQFGGVTGTLNSQMKAMWASVDRLAIALGDALLPKLTAAATMASELAEGMTAAGSSSDGLGAKVLQGFETVASAIAGAADALSLLNAGWQTMKGFAQAAIGGALLPMALLIEGVEYLANKLTGSASDWGKTFRLMTEDLIETSKASFAAGNAAMDAFTSGANSAKVRQFFDEIDRRVAAVAKANAEAADQQLIADIFSIEPDNNDDVEDIFNIDPAIDGVGQLASMWDRVAGAVRSVGGVAIDQVAKHVKKQAESLKDEAKAITEAVRTPAEVFGDEIDRLQRLFDLGFITEDVFGRAAAQARADLEDATRVEQGPIGAIAAGSAEAQRAAFQVPQAMAMRDRPEKIQQKTLTENEKQTGFQERMVTLLDTVAAGVGNFVEVAF